MARSGKIEYYATSIGDGICVRGYDKYYTVDNNGNVKSYKKRESSWIKMGDVIPNGPCVKEDLRLARSLMVVHNESVYFAKVVGVGVDAIKLFMIPLNEGEDVGYLELNNDQIDWYLSERYIVKILVI